MNSPTPLNNFARKKVYRGKKSPLLASVGEERKITGANFIFYNTRIWSVGEAGEEY